MKKKVWVVVADEAIARILEQPHPGGELTAVEELTDPDAHAKESELHHGPHGRRASGGGGSHATVSAADSERHQHAQVFAGRIAKRLSQLQGEGRYDALHVAAAPRMLGHLRKALDAGVTATVGQTLDKDVVKESHADLTRRFFGERAKS